MRHSFTNQVMRVLGPSTTSQPHCKEPFPKIGNKYSQERNCAATVPISTTIDLAILLQEICGPIQGI
jgi:hypothetical protein